MSAATEKPPLSIIQQAVLRRLGQLDLPPGSAILDAPCGAGLLALALGEAGNDVWAADLEPEAQPRLGPRFRPADLNAPLPWPDASFDLILCIEGVEHLENRYAFLREARRLLKPGGSLLITTPNILSLRSRVRYYCSGFFGQDPRPLNESARHPLHHINLCTFPELRYALHTSGFRIVEVGHTHARAISYLYAVHVPFLWLYTRIAFRKEKDAAQRARNLEIRCALFTPSLLFGENLMVLSRAV